jgi:N-glycosylase/DNA lyase
MKMPSETNIISSEGLDLNQTLLCGQVFRWKKVADSIIGIDGSHFAKFSDASGGGIQIENSNAPTAVWEKFFQLEPETTDVWDRLSSADSSFNEDFSYLRGLRLLRPTNPLEVLFSFLCTSNNHLSRIQKMVDCMSNLGKPVANVDGHPISTFPTLERLSKVTEDDLRDWGFGYRGATIPIVVSQLQDRGDNWLDDLKCAEYVEARAELTELAGVGPKLADCICLYALHFDSAVPVDTHVCQAVTRRYLASAAQKKPSPSRYDEIANVVRDRFGNLAGWAQLILYYDNLLQQRKVRYN